MLLCLLIVAGFRQGR